MTPEQRKERARMAANSRWARPFAREEQAEAARNALNERFRRQVDPDLLLDGADLERLIESARRAYAARMRMARARKHAA